MALADAEYARKIWTRYQDIPALQNDDITILHGSVAALDPSSKTAVVIDANTKRQHSYSYDYFIAASGLRRVWPVVPQSLTREGYLSEVENHINTLATAIHGVVVVGGGAVGIEMAAELKVVRPEVKVTLVHSGDKLLSSEGLSEECKDRTLELLKEMDVDVLLRRRVVRSSDSGKGTKEVEFTDGQRLTASQIIMAVSRSVPSTSYLPPKVLDQDGYVRILPKSVVFLFTDGYIFRITWLTWWSLSFAHTMLNAASHFCAGDAASWSGIKRCGAAMHSGHYVAYNIHQSIMASLTSHKPKFMELEEIPPMIGLAVGRKAIASGPDMGTISGEDVMKLYFNDDLGFTSKYFPIFYLDYTTDSFSILPSTRSIFLPCILYANASAVCWNHLQLNGRKAAELGP